MKLAGKQILVTGGVGFLGSYVVKKLIEHGASLTNIFIPRSKTDDLRYEKNCHRVVKGKNIVIHLAGNVGGIGKNEKLPGSMFYDNALMGVHLLHEAMMAKVKKVVIIGTVCSYPKITPIPFREENFWSGYPEETNAPYALAKKMLLVQAQAYRQQYGLKSIYLIPVNLYGPGDKNNLKTSHVVPSLIRKVLEAKKEDKKHIEVWGDGTATREFLYVEDAAEGIVLATKKFNQTVPVNLGSGEETSIKKLISLIIKLTNYKGLVRWNPKRPTGQPRRCLDVSVAKKEFGFMAQTKLKNGLEKTIKWYEKEYQKLS